MHDCHSFHSYAHYTLHSGQPADRRACAVCKRNIHSHWCRSAHDYWGQYTMTPTHDSHSRCADVSHTDASAATVPVSDTCVHAACRHNIRWCWCRSAHDYWGLHRRILAHDSPPHPPDARHTAVPPAPVPMDRSVHAVCRHNTHSHWCRSAHDYWGQYTMTPTHDSHSRCADVSHTDASAATVPMDRSVHAACRHNTHSHWYTAHHAHW